MGNGVSAEQSALALGITPSAVSQYLDDEEVAAEISARRYTQLSGHNQRDANYDKLEDRLLEQLEFSVPMLTDPMKIQRVLATINAAKRRGTSTPESILNKQNHVTLVLPTKIVNNYQVNGNNQVVRIGDTDLVTIQSDTLLKKVKQNEPATNTEAIGTT
jgi:hypothetical protein